MRQSNGLMICKYQIHKWRYFLPLVFFYVVCGFHILHATYTKDVYREAYLEFITACMKYKLFFRNKKDAWGARTTSTQTKRDFFVCVKMYRLSWVWNQPLVARIPMVNLLLWCICNHSKAMHFSYVKIINRKQILCMHTYFQQKCTCNKVR